MSSHIGLLYPLSSLSLFFSLSLTFWHLSFGQRHLPDPFVVDHAQVEALIVQIDGHAARLVVLLARAQQVTGRPKVVGVQFEPHGECDAAIAHERIGEAGQVARHAARGQPRGSCLAVSTWKKRILSLFN